MESTPLFAIILLETVDFRNSLFWGQLFGCPAEGVPQDESQECQANGEGKPDTHQLWPIALQSDAKAEEPRHRWRYNQVTQRSRWR